MRGRHARKLVVAILTLSLVFLTQVTALGGHGSWHHNYHLWDPSPSLYYAYAHTTSSSSSDLLYARIQVFHNGSLKADRSSTCGWVNEGCSNEQTTTAAWNQGGSHELWSYHCGVDGSHHLSLQGNGCSMSGYGGTGTHTHTTDWSD